MPIAARPFVLLIFVGLAMAACGNKDYAVSSPKRAKAVESGQPPRDQVSDIKVGKPYKVNGKRYTPEEDWGYNQTGVASWYGKKFHGRQTANGEIFDMHQLTAAHPTLPLPVIAEVTNLSNGRSVKVRINDRGPFAHGRLIDLSRAAAQKLGFIEQGTAKVRVQVIPQESLALLEGTKPVEPEPPTLIAAVPVREASAVYLQVGSFAERSNANALRRQLEDFGKIHVQPVRLSGKQYYRVRMGPFVDATAALHARERLAKAGFFRSHLAVEREN